jgi:hypothetical protein
MNNYVKQFVEKSNEPGIEMPRMKRGGKLEKRSLGEGDIGEWFNHKFFKIKYKIIHGKKKRKIKRLLKKESDIIF